MANPSTDDDTLDVLQSSLHLIGASPVDESPDVRFGPLVVSRPPRTGKANTLLADQVFNPGLVTAEQVQSGRISVAGLSVLELGCGAGLPSLVSASLEAKGRPELVVLTDYPDEAIIAALESNLARNAGLLRCPVNAVAYAWGEDPKALLSLLPPEKQGFDVLILSDLIHLTPPIVPLLDSLTNLLSRLSTSSAYVAVAPYTRPPVVQAFIEAAEAVGLVWTQWDIIGQGKWDGPDVVGLGELTGQDALWEMKKTVTGWTVRWSDEALRNS